jgi:hypothetical protein
MYLLGWCFFMSRFEYIYSIHIKFFIPKILMKNLGILGIRFLIEKELQ